MSYLSAAYKSVVRSSKDDSSEGERPIPHMIKNKRSTTSAGSEKKMGSSVSVSVADCSICLSSNYSLNGSPSAAA